MTSSPNSGMPSRSSKKPPKKRRGLKVFLWFLTLILLIGGGIIGYLYVQFNGLIGDVAADSPNAAPVPKGELASEKPKTLLLLGLDSRKQTHTMLTDVIMVVTLNPKTKHATIVSIPRDTRMEVPGFNRVSKANSYYAAFHNKNDYNDPVDTNMKSFFGKYLDVPIDYVSTINFQGFREVVDAVGGVEVDIDMDMRYTDSADGTDIDLKKGDNQLLNGDNALDFVRYRKSNHGTGASSDLERNARQQQVIHQLVDKLKSFQGITKINGIFKALGDNVSTDIQEEQLKSFITTYIGISNDNIEYIPLDGTWKSPYIHIDEQQLEAAKSKLKATLEGSQ
ncbi:LCP family protein [Paenibacillus gansuensis]|uniref:LCP family protein n=1 Tax=Paenibacillus gansuensis TaxID=306542 RepID=A0ABW5PDW3_9BACL